MEMRRYILMRADDAHEAWALTDSFLERHHEDDFYEDYDLHEHDIVRLRDVSAAYFAEMCAEAEERMERLKREIKAFEETGQKSLLGRAHIRYGQMLWEDFCKDMPYFNPDFWDWSVPEDNEQVRLRWFAVPVTFYA